MIALTGSSPCDSRISAETLIKFTTALLQMEESSYLNNYFSAIRPASLKLVYKDRVAIPSKSIRPSVCSNPNSPTRTCSKISRTLMKTFSNLMLSLISLFTDRSTLIFTVQIFKALKRIIFMNCTKLKMWIIILMRGIFKIIGKIIVLSALNHHPRTGIQPNPITNLTLLKKSIMMFLIAAQHF